MEVVGFAEARFKQVGLCFGHGMESARDEAVYLLLHALGRAPDDSDLHPDQVLTADERETVARLYGERIATRKPAAYLTHEAWFAGLRFYVDSRVLVPRSPLAELVEDRFQPWVEVERVSTILDIGTGSGCIGIACAIAFPEAHVDVTDVSTGALCVAERNVRMHGVTNRVTAYRSDLFPQAVARRYDIIVSNPPYVSDAAMTRLPDEYAHEPELGLRAGSEGLDLVRRILCQAPRWLSHSGILVVEVGEAAEALANAYPEVPFMWLEFARGGDGVFLLTADQCRQHFAGAPDGPGT